MLEFCNWQAKSADPAGTLALVPRFPDPGPSRSRTFPIPDLPDPGPWVPDVSAVLNRYGELPGTRFFVGSDFLGMLQRFSDVIETVQQIVLATGVNLKSQIEAVGILNALFMKVHGQQVG